MNKRVVIWLCVLWLVTLLVGGEYASAYLESQHEISNALSIFSSYSIFVMLVVLFWFVPLLYTISVYAKRAEMKLVCILAKVILIQHVIWLILFVVEAIGALVA